MSAESDRKAATDSTDETDRHGAAESQAKAGLTTEHTEYTEKDKEEDIGMRLDRWLFLPFSVYSVCSVVGCLSFRAAEIVHDLPTPVGHRTKVEETIP